MNDITIHNIKEERAGLDPEQLWLLSAMRDGYKDYQTGRTVEADDVVFDELRTRIVRKAAMVSQLA